jgi:hypothetical protein
MRRTHKRSTQSAGSSSRPENRSDWSSAEPAPAGDNRSRRHRLTISGGVVPRETLPPNEHHPFAHLTADERKEIAEEALGRLILRAIEDDASERSG